MAKLLVLRKSSRIFTDQSVEFQCKEQGHRAYDYVIEIAATEKLDENDFIIDHTVVHDVIANVIQNKMGSCERLCLRVEEDVLRTLKEHGCHVQKIDFSIQPVNSNAGMRIVSEYEKSDAELEREMREWAEGMSFLTDVER